MDVSRFSAKNKLHHAIAWVLNFIKNLKMARSKGSVVKDNHISTNDLNIAEHILITSIQSEALAQELACMASKSNSKPPIYVSQLNLNLDKEGIVRCRTRIDKANVAE